MPAYDSIPISLLRQYVFCPRIPYFVEIMGLKPEKPLWVEQGNQFHEWQRKNIFKNRKFSRLGFEKPSFRFDSLVRSKNLGIHGKIDCIIFDEENEKKVVPVEFKYSRSKIRKNQIVQIVAYACCLEEELKTTVNKSLFVNKKNGSAITLDITNKERLLLTRTIADLHESLEKNFMPQSSATSYQCDQCEYFNYCNDRE